MHYQSFTRNEKKNHIFRNNVNSYKCHLLFRVLFRYGLMQVNCSILFSTKRMEDKASNWYIRSHSHLQKLQEALLTAIIFFTGDLVWTKWNMHYSILHLLSKSHYHPSQVHTFTEQEMHKATMLWIAGPCFIKCFQFCLGTWSTWAGSSSEVHKGPFCIHWYALFIYRHAEISGFFLFSFLFSFL